MFLAVILRPKVLEVCCGQFDNDQDAWKGQPYDTDRGVKQTCSPQNETPASCPETRMLTETRAIGDAIDMPNYKRLFSSSFDRLPKV